MRNKYGNRQRRTSQITFIWIKCGTIHICGECPYCPFLREGIFFPNNYSIWRTGENMYGKFLHCVFDRKQMLENFLQKKSHKMINPNGEGSGPIFGPSKSCLGCCSRSVVMFILHQKNQFQNFPAQSLASSPKCIWPE